MTKKIQTTHKPLIPLFDSLLNNKPTSPPHHFPYPEDYKQAANFIHSYRGSEATYNSYRREIERLLQWSAHIAHKSLRELKREDLENYLYFCQQPPKDWISLKRVDRFIKKDGTRIPNP